MEDPQPAQDPAPATPARKFSQAELEESEKLRGHFVNWWKEEGYDLYNDFGEKVKSLFKEAGCLANLHVSKINSIVLARAKFPQKIDFSVSKREDHRRENRGLFKSFEEIRDEIPDLAGICIILVFPNDEAEVVNFINKITTPHRTLYWGVRQNESLRLEQFEERSKKGNNDRFVGYRARHFRVHLNEDLKPTPKARHGEQLSSESEQWDLESGPMAWLDERLPHLREYWNEKWNEKHCRHENCKKSHWDDINIEIQITSTTMYAWREIHHDLIHNPLQGELTTAEKATLDIVNGIVLANEVAVNVFHDGLNRRLEEIRRPFRDADDVKHWLMRYLEEEVHNRHITSASMEYTEQLFETLPLFKLNTPEEMFKMLRSSFEFSARTSKRAVADWTKSPPYPVAEDFASLELLVESLQEWKLRTEYMLRINDRRADASA